MPVLQHFHYPQQFSSSPEARRRFTESVAWNSRGNYENKRLGDKQPMDRTKDQYRPGSPTALPLSTGDAETMPDLMIGDVVYVNGEGDWRGKVCYVGEVHFAKGDWAGVALDHPMGNHDGTTHSRRYFQCTPNHGIFTRVSRLSKRMQIPQTLNAEKLGLLKDLPRFQREYSKSPEPRELFSSQKNNYHDDYISYANENTNIKSRSVSRESTPNRGVTTNRNVKFDFDTNNSSTYGNKSRSPTPTATNKELKIGERVIVVSSVGDSKAGVLRFQGEVDFAEGTWAGIELFQPLGKNDGTVRGREYFRCEHPYGLFVPLSKVETSPANKTLGKKFVGTRESLYHVMAATRGVRAGSYEEYY